LSMKPAGIPASSTRVGFSKSKIGRGEEFVVSARLDLPGDDCKDPTNEF